jgi:hypothetical protein
VPCSLTQAAGSSKRLQPDVQHMHSFKCYTSKHCYTSHNPWTVESCCAQVIEKHGSSRSSAAASHVHASITQALPWQKQHRNSNSRDEMQSRYSKPLTLPPVADAMQHNLRTLSCCTSALGMCSRRAVRRLAAPGNFCAAAMPSLTAAQSQPRVLPRLGASADCRSRLSDCSSSSGGRSVLQRWDWVDA